MSLSLSTQYVRQADRPTDRFSSGPLLLSLQQLLCFVHEFVPVDCFVYLHVPACLLACRPVPALQKLYTCPAASSSSSMPPSSPLPLPLPLPPRPPPNQSLVTWSRRAWRRAPRGRPSRGWRSGPWWRRRSRGGRPPTRWPSRASAPPCSRPGRRTCRVSCGEQGEME